MFKNGLDFNRVFSKHFENALNAVGPEDHARYQLMIEGENNQIIRDYTEWYNAGNFDKGYADFIDRKESKK